MLQLQLQNQPKTVQRLVPTADSLKFGLSLGLYHGVFEGKDEFTRYGDYNPAFSESLYSDRERFYYDTKVTEMVPPEETQKYLEAHKLGIIEEAGDILFEYSVLTALKKDIITEELIDHVMETLVKPSCEGKKTFEFVPLLDEILTHIPDNKQNQFLDIIGNFNPQKAKHLLALGVFKFAVFKAKNPAYNPLEDTRHYLYSEVEELQEHLEKNRLSGKHLSPFIRYADKHQLPLKMVALYPKLLVDNYFKKHFTARELLKYAFIKQMGRQEFNYLHPEMSYNERKSHYKFKEAILEASFLKRKGVAP